ncbi:MAG: hypothetical protein ABI688_07305, partial [Bacteroidota bacterium]
MSVDKGYLVYWLIGLFVNLVIQESGDKDFFLIRQFLTIYSGIQEIFMLPFRGIGNFILKNY